MKPIRIAIAALAPLLMIGALSSVPAQAQWVPRLVGGDGSIRDILWTGKVFVAVDPGEGHVRSKGLADTAEAA